MKLMLTIDGGGIRGIIPAEICAELEDKTKKQIFQIFDMISSTSTGAILGSQLAVGVPAQQCRDLYLKKGPKLFDSRSKLLPWNWFREKYDRKPIMDELKKSFKDDSPLKHANPQMKNCLTNYMCTSVSLVDERNHFFKSWDIKDEKLNLLDCVARSFAAAYYFGAINDPKNNQVWADGGEGGDNCTIRECIMEAIKMDWIQNEGVYILSLGCGAPKPGIPYKKASRMRWVGETKFYMNLARRQSAIDQVYEGKVLEDKMKQKIIIDRLDIQIPKKMDELDAVKYAADFSKMTIEQLFPKSLINALANIKKAQIKKIDVKKP